MKDIVSLLRQKEEQLQLLAKQVEALRVAAQLMAQEQNLLGSSETKAPSQPEMIRIVLAAKREPMHTSEISEAIKKKFNKRLKPTYLTAVLYRCMKAGRFFYKVKDRPNTFGLLSWQGNGTGKVPLEASASNSLRND